VSADPASRTVYLIVLDSVGCGAQPDAAAYGDDGADTLGHVASFVGGLHLPFLQSLGLGNVHAIEGVPACAQPRALHCKMAQRSRGKDTTTGHWEIAGLVLEEPFAVFAGGFPAGLIAAFERETGRGTLGNVAASGTAIIEKLGADHIETGRFIVYTSADSVFQIAAHESVVPLARLYEACEIARKLCDVHNIARIIARPFVGNPGSFVRTYNRRDFSMQPTGPTMLDRLVGEGVRVTAVGKIEDIFAGRGISRAIHTEGNADGMQRTLELARRGVQGLVFVNLVDFDMLYGHRNDPTGYAAALQAVDGFLPLLDAQLGPADSVILTADHGCDPTFAGTDHTREYVPLLLYGPGIDGGAVADRTSFADVAETVLTMFGLSPMGSGTSIEQALQVIN
jgi:phosphopentomutase